MVVGYRLSGDREENGQPENIDVYKRQYLNDATAATLDRGSGEYSGLFGRLLVTIRFLPRPEREACVKVVN